MVTRKQAPTQAGRIISGPLLEPPLARPSYSAKNGSRAAWDATMVNEARFADTDDDRYAWTPQNKSGTVMM